MIWARRSADDARSRSSPSPAPYCCPGGQGATRCGCSSGMEQRSARRRASPSTSGTKRRRPPPSVRPSTRCSGWKTNSACIGRTRRSRSSTATAFSTGRPSTCCARRFGELTGGAFDVTVQPLWQLYAAHFTAHPDDADGPSAAELRRACHLGDFRRIEVAPGRITLPPEMAFTLNGIAQGYITDRIAELLRARGWTDVLIDLGELRGLGGHPDGRPWTIGLPDPRRAQALIAEIPLGQRAAATSAGSGTTFDRAGRYHHLFVPRTGRSATTYSAVTVVAERGDRGRRPLDRAFR